MPNEIDIPFDEEDLDIPDDALAEIAEIEPSLTNQERKYIYWRSLANPPLVAFKKAQYSGSSWRQVETRPKIREALMSLNERLEPQYRVTQQKVVGILMEAVEMARMKGQAKVLVEAATALANISGVAAATKYRIDQNTQVSIHNRAEEIKALQHLPRHQLEGIVGIQRALPSPYIDAEFVEINQDD